MPTPYGQQCLGVIVRVLSLVTMLVSIGYADQPATTVALQPVSFCTLKGWNDEQVAAVRPALLNSCRQLARAANAANNHAKPVAAIWGSPAQWATLCQLLAHVPANKLRAGFEQHCRVYQVAPEQSGLFTGYYTPVIEGRRQPALGFSSPLLQVPSQQDAIQPNDSRQVIEQKIANNKIRPSQVLVWLRDPVEAFFLHIQGSGTIQLSNDEYMPVGYAGDNGHPYVAIGKVLKAAGALQAVTMDTIKGWLHAHPKKRQWLFNKNPRYIFFKKTEAIAVTAQGVPAVAQHTLAVDPNAIPLGTPVWLDTTLTASGQPYQRLLIAQDTGSAIKGAVRGDIYFGAGSAAARLAGQQQSPGKLFVIVPK